MMAAPIDLFKPSVQEDWYPTYRAMQEEAPVYLVPGTRMYVLTKYEDIAAVVRDPVLFSNRADLHGGEPLLLHADARAIYDERGWPKRHPLSADPPEHKGYRALVDPFFTGEGLARARPVVEAAIDRLIDQLPHGDAEFVAAFAEPLPVEVITTLIGFPLDDIPQLKTWSAAWALPFARGLSHEQEMWVANEGVAFQHYIKRHIDERRTASRDDIISRLIAADFEGRPLDDGEIISIVDHLYIGGNETTTFALGSGLWLMLADTGVRDRLIADPSRIKNFVEEVLRLESPTQGLYRTATRDCEVRGVAIPRGSTLHLRFAAANRDPDIFACPHQIDLDRRNAGRHMAFSQSEHHCPGAGLSRLELNLAFAALIKRLPNLRLTPGANDFTHVPGFVLRALKALNVSYDGRT